MEHLTQTFCYILPLIGIYCLLTVDWNYWTYWFVDPCLDLLIFRRRIVLLSFIAQWYTLITSDTIDWKDETKHLKLTSSSFKTFKSVKISSNKAISSVDWTAAFSASFSITLWWLNDLKWPQMTRKIAIFRKHNVEIRVVNVFFNLVDVEKKNQ